MNMIRGKWLKFAKQSSEMLSRTVGVWEISASQNPLTSLRKGSNFEEGDMKVPIGDMVRL